MRSSEPQTSQSYVVSTMNSSSALIAATTPENERREEAADAEASCKECDKGTDSLLSQGMPARSQTREPLGNASFEARYCHRARQTQRGFAKTS